MNKSGINDLTTAGLEALVSQVSLMHLKKLFDYTSLAQALSEESHSCSIRNIIHYTKANKLFEGATVIYFEFDLFIA